MTTDSVLVGEIEGRILGELNGEWTLKVGDNEGDLEYLHEWIRLNAPKNTYVVITIAILEGV